MKQYTCISQVIGKTIQGRLDGIDYDLDHNFVIFFEGGFMAFSIKRYYDIGDEEVIISSRIDENSDLFKKIVLAIKERQPFNSNITESVENIQEFVSKNNLFYPGLRDELADLESDIADNSLKKR